VNPKHLEVATFGENTRRSERTTVGKNIRKMECLRGHPFNSPWVEGEIRVCKECDAVRQATTVSVNLGELYEPLTSFVESRNATRYKKQGTRAAVLREAVALYLKVQANA